MLPAAGVVVFMAVLCCKYDVSIPKRVEEHFNILCGRVGCSEC